MTFAEDYDAYHYWAANQETTPRAWEVQRDLEADAEFYRENKEDIREALDMLYRARSWWTDHPDLRNNPEVIGSWFLMAFRRDLDQWVNPDDDLPF